jgi:hypothetical protein
MKYFALYYMVIIAMLASCKNNTTINSFLKTSNLKSSFISLNADSTYVLKTPKGAVIKIAKNTFDVAANTKIKLEIKEAYSMQDILLAGLSTTSNGKLLKSGGMIYINATADDKEVNFLKPVNISIPTKAYDDSMQLFKGEVKNDSSINWVDPQPLDSSPIAKQLVAGKALYSANCASCHKTTEDFTGPVLAGSRDREPTKDWIYRFIYHSNSMVNTDPYAIALKNKFGSVMTQQNEINLTKQDVKAILDWADNEALLLPEVPQSTVALDSTAAISDSIAPCGYDSVYAPLPDTNIQDLSADTSLQTDTTSFKNILPYIPPTYQFNVFANGWYNIDCFIEANENAVTSVQLTATLNMPIDTAMQVYLCIPQRKLLSDERGNNGNEYTFYDSSPTIQLILNDDAFIFVTGSYKDKMYYGITRFTVNSQENIIVNVKESTKEKILQSIKNNNLGDVKIDVWGPGIINSIDTTIITNDTLKQEMQMQILKKNCGTADSSRKIKYLAGK